MNAPKFEVLTEEQVSQYTIGGLARLEHQYIDQTNEKQEELLEKYYNEETISRFKHMAKYRQPNYYGITDFWLFSALDANKIKDKDVLIIGSTQPWYEIVAYEWGAKSVIVSEYADRPVKIDNIKYIKPSDFELGGYSFDAIISVSSFEHDGLGRYGDPLSPNADLESMQLMRELMKPGGKLFLSIPVGLDAIVWNSHRIYGVHRLKMLFEGWRLLGAFGMNNQMLNMNTGIKADYQPVFVLEVQNENHS